MRRFWTFAALVPLLAVACASTDWEAQYLDMEEEARAVQEQNDALRLALAENDAMSEEIRQELRSSQESVDVLAAEIGILKNQPPPANPAEGEMMRLQAELNRLRQRYENVSLTPDGNIEITLNSDVSFGSGKKKLSQEGRKILDSVAVELQTDFAGHLIRVVGHTDNEPIKKSPYEDNWELGAERALEVIRYLAATHGLDEGNLVAASRGSSSPIGDNGSKEGRQRNRRIEIIVVIPRIHLVGQGD